MSAIQSMLELQQQLIIYFTVDLIGVRVDIVDIRLRFIHAVLLEHAWPAMIKTVEISTPSLKLIRVMY